MRAFNMLQAKSNLSRLVDLVESGAESEIIIARGGRPAARLVPIEPYKGTRIGVAKGKFAVPDAIDELEPDILALMTGATEQGRSLRLIW